MAAHDVSQAGAVLLPMTSADLKTRPLRVLVVAGHAEDRATLRRVLKDDAASTYDVRDAWSAEEVLAALAREPVDCVVIDTELPGGAALELVREIVSIYRLHACAVVVLAAPDMHFLQGEALDYGAHDFLLKEGASMLTLPKRVRNAVQKAAMLRELEARREELSRKDRELKEHVLQLEREILERRRTESHAECLARLGQRLGVLSDPGEMVRIAQETIGLHLRAQRCVFLEISADGRHATIEGDWRIDGVKSAAGRYDMMRFGTGEFVRQLGSPRFSISDVSESPFVGAALPSHLQMDSRALATAAYYQDGRWAVSLLVASAEARVWRDDELAFLENVVARFWPLIEKARSDRLLIDSAQQLQMAVSTAQLGLWSWDVREDRVKLSLPAGRILGVDPGAPLSWSELSSLWHEDDRSSARAAVDEALNTHTEFVIECRLYRPDSPPLWLAFTGRGRYGEEGALLGMVGVVQDITARKEAELATGQLAAIVKFSDDAVVSKNLDGIVTSWNAGAERLFGYTAQEMIGLPIIVLLPPEHYDEEPRILERIRRGEPVEHFETVRRHKSGRLIDVSLTISPIKDDRGRIVGASKIARDISRRKATENALARRTHILEILNRVGDSLVSTREVESLMRTVVDAGREIDGADFGIFVHHFINNAGGQETLRVVSGVPEAVVEQLGLPADWLAPITDSRGAVCLPPTVDEEKVPAGYPPPQSLLAVPVKSGGSVVGALLFGHSAADAFTPEVIDVLEGLAAQAAIALDNAHLYRAVQRELNEHKLAREAVRAREAQLRLVTNNAPVFLLQCDRHYRYTFANEPYAARYGMTPAMLIGLTVEEVVGESAFLAARAHIDAALAGERVEFEMEIAYDRIGSRWVHAIFVPDKSEGKTVSGFVAVITDITQRKQAERELERARDDALAASRAKDDFLAALSHELRTPLNPVLLLASDAAEDPSLPTEVRHAFETIRRQVNLEARLIDDLLDLTRVTRGKLSLDRRIIDAHAVLVDALATVKPEVEKKEIALSLNLAATRHQIFGDVVRLQQVFWNVLKNAVKFTSDRGRIHVETTTTAQDRLRIEVSDTGIGLTEKEKERIFDAFSQGEHASESSHRFGGLGLGLAISRSLVEMHGGDIRADSEGRNRGAVFSIELPLMSATYSSDSPTKTTVSAATVSSSPQAPRRARLLVVEDHAPTRATLKSLLARRHFDVRTAGSAIEAREIAAEWPPDLLVSDIGLPDSDGCTLLRELRASNPALPGIALSGYGMDEDLARTRMAGFAEHLTKPVNVSSLERAIEAIFSRPSHTA